MSTIDALWVGPGGFVLTNGTSLEPGQTVVQISEGEATASDNWQPLTQTPPTPSALPKPVTPPASGSNTDEGKN